MSSFSSEDLERYHETYLAARGTFEALAAAYAAKDFRDETARTFATHGFPCRLEFMDSLSPEFAGRLKELGPWFEYRGLSAAAGEGGAAPRPA